MTNFNVDVWYIPQLGGYTFVNEKEEGNFVMPPEHCIGSYI